MRATVKAERRSEESGSASLAWLLIVVVQDFLRVVRSLSAEQYVVFEKAKEQTVYSLSEEGEDYAKNGSPEARLWKAIPDAGVATADVAVRARLTAINSQQSRGNSRQQT